MKNPLFKSAMTVLVVLCIAFAIILIFSACSSEASAIGFNKQIIDWDYKFNQAEILNGADAGTYSIKSWADYDDSDVVQFTTIDGTVFLTHYNNVILSYRPN